MNMARKITEGLFDAYGIKNLMLNKRATVIERIARGAGNFRVYLCNQQIDLQYLNHKFSPGSVISFYFDRRIEIVSFCKISPDLFAHLKKEDGDCMIGRLDKNGIDVDAGIFSHFSEVQDYFSECLFDDIMLAGRFPSCAYDGKDAITFILPDEDGVFRSNPH